MHLMFTILTPQICQSGLNNEWERWADTQRALRMIRKDQSSRMARWLVQRNVLLVWTARRNNCRIRLLPRPVWILCKHGVNMASVSLVTQQTRPCSDSPPHPDSPADNSALSLLCRPCWLLLVCVCVLLLLLLLLLAHALSPSCF